ncbi:MAG: HEAT repeat domain-containing protein [Verrucomicrobia bacterium]|nr:HEAT repeat domain-containing protein [Verrucomicrobiota bacterium]MDA1087752.1 HEAT repeat domain-containing protein [Verrucomicrobiota bacterium]
MKPQNDPEELDLPRNLGVDQDVARDLLSDQSALEEAPAEPGEPGWPESRWGRLLHSLFVIPFFIALFGIIVAVLVYVLVADDRSVDDYLEDIQTSRGNRRWQSAFELSKHLVAADRVPHSEAFIARMIDLFDDETLKQDDPRVRQYLALAMGRSGLREFYAPLAKALGESTEDELTTYIQALGMLQMDEAASAIEAHLGHADSRTRLAAVIALGNIRADSSIPLLREMLTDKEPNVTWDAAIALAKFGDPAGREILERLLTREYFEEFDEVNTEERTRAMIVAIQAAAELNDTELNAMIARLEKDPNLQIRSAVLSALSARGRE